MYNQLIINSILTNQPDIMARNKNQKSELVIVVTIANNWNIRKNEN